MDAPSQIRNDEDSKFHIKHMIMRSPLDQYPHHSPRDHLDDLDMHSRRSPPPPPQKIRCKMFEENPYSIYPPPPPSSGRPRLMPYPPPQHHVPIAQFLNTWPRHRVFERRCYMSESQDHDHVHHPVPHLLMRHPMLPNHFYDTKGAHHDHFSFSAQPPQRGCLTYMRRLGAPCATTLQPFITSPPPPPPPPPPPSRDIREMIPDARASPQNVRQQLSAEFQSRAQNLNAIARSLQGRTPQANMAVEETCRSSKSPSSSYSSPASTSSSVDLSPTTSTTNIPMLIDTATDENPVGPDGEEEDVEYKDDSKDDDASVANGIIKKHRKYVYNPKPIVQRVKVVSVLTKASEDLEYLEMRCRNNEAARRSRHLRRQKELEVMSQRKNLKFSKVELEKKLRELKSKCEYMEKLVLRRFDKEQ